MGENTGLSELEHLVERWRVQFNPFVEERFLTGREIPGRVVRESVEYFFESGGEPGIIARELGSKFRESSNRGLFGVSSISVDDLLDDSRFYTDETFALLSFLLKIDRGDASFCFNSVESELYDAGHKLYEVAPLRSKVFIEPNSSGSVSCRNFGAALDTMRDICSERAQDRGWDVDKYVNSRLEFLFRMFNVFINNEGLYIDRKDLIDPRLWVRYEASQFFLEACKIVTGRSDFVKIMAARNFPVFIKLLANILDVGTGFHEITGIANKYNSLLDIGLKERGTGYAVVSVTPSDVLRDIAGKRFNACMQLSCDVAKYTMEKIPKLYGLNSYGFVEVSCCVENAIDFSDRAGGMVPKGHICEYHYKWFPIATGWRRLLNPVFLLGAANIPLIPAVIGSDMSSLEKVLMIGTGLIAPLGAAAVNKIFNQQRHIGDIEEYHRIQENKAEQQRHDLLQREIDVAKTNLEHTYSSLYLMSLQYTDYLRLLKGGDIDAALSQMDTLQDTVVKYLEDTALKGARNTGLLDFRRKLDDAALFLAYGQAVDGTFNPLTGKSGSAVFLTESDEKRTNISKRFALKEMGSVEALVYSWFRDKGMKEMMRFPTPEILAYRVVPSWDESKSCIVEVPIMLMEQIDGPTLYDFFRMLNNKTCLDGSGNDLTRHYIDSLKDSVIDRLLERYCYLTDQLQSDEEGSLGRHLDLGGVVRIREGAYIAKTTEVFEDCLMGDACPDSQKEVLYVVAQIIGEVLDKVKKVPFIDMGSLNASLPARSLYSRLLLLHEGVDDFSAEVSAVEKPARTTMELALDDMVSHMDDADFRENIFDVCADELVRFDFEKLRIDTLEFDDLSHMTDFLPYGSSPERRAKVNARYLALRYVAKDEPCGQHILGLIHEGRTDDAVELMRSVIDYSSIESERALVSIYRNLRWVRFYSDLDADKFDDLHSKKQTREYHLNIILEDIGVYLRENSIGRMQDRVISLDSAWQDVSDRGIIGALSYLKHYLNGIIDDGGGQS